MAVVVTENKFVHSVYYPEKNVLHSTYKGKPVKEHVLDHYQRTMALSENNRVLGSLIDLRKVFGSYFKYIEMLAGEVYPKMQQTGLKALAYVISDDILVKNVTYKLVEAVSKQEIEAKIFTDLNEAKLWLEGYLDESV